MELGATLDVPGRQRAKNFFYLFLPPEAKKKFTPFSPEPKNSRGGGHPPPLEEG